MRKSLGRRLAALAVVAVAAPLLFAGVAGALPDAHGTPPAAPAVGAPGGAGAMVPGAGPDACPRGLSAAQADRQAQQLASQSASRSASQVAPNSNCCPHCDPNPPPPAPNCNLSIGDPYRTTRPIKAIWANGSVNCLGSAPIMSIFLLVSIYEEDNPNPVGLGQITASNTRSAEVTGAASCVNGIHYATVKAVVTYGTPSNHSSKSYGPYYSAEVPINCG